MQFAKTYLSCVGVRRLGRLWHNHATEASVRGAIILVRVLLINAPILLMLHDGLLRGRRRRGLLQFGLRHLRGRRRRRRGRGQHLQDERIHLRVVVAVSGSAGAAGSVPEAAVLGLLGRAQIVRVGALRAANLVHCLKIGSLTGCVRDKGFFRDLEFSRVHLGCTTSSATHGRF